MTHKNQWREPKTYPVSWLMPPIRWHIHSNMELRGCKRDMFNMRVFPNLARKIRFQGWVPCLWKHLFTNPLVMQPFHPQLSFSSPTWQLGQGQHELQRRLHRSHEIHPVSWLVSIKPLSQSNTPALLQHIPMVKFSLMSLAMSCKLVI